ncbi:hypothetical protein [Methylobacterium radiodurans]|uniref:hypothetical protein n=1 Tax=Methylobacterium radiodurans TaxID=2202828 RepID=UPI001FE26649|nr:hypothetical protein [Methylobacterium radiodurans]
MVRRLIARPIRLEYSQHLAEEAPPEAVADEPAPDGEADEVRDVAALEAELALLKAVLDAERREAASLRARLADPAAGSDPADGLAVRERWAALVDELLLRLR